MNTVNELAKAYNEKYWLDFVKLFTDIHISSNEFVGMPKDIACALIGLMGKEEAKLWILRPLERLDNNIMIDLVKTDLGIKAAKMFILSMRI